MRYKSIFSQGLSTEHLGFYDKIIFTLPIIPVYLLLAVIGVVQGIYAKYFGVSLATIATVVLVSRVFDAISDPIIGYCSDWYNARGGTRKPFVLAGSFLFLLGSYFLYIPPENVTTSYFAASFLLYYVGFTIFEIPYLAWGGELAQESAARNTIFSYRAFGIYFGTLLFFMIPLMPFSDGSDVTPDTLKWCVLFAGFLMFPALYLCLKRIPRGNSPTNQNKSVNYLGNGISDLIREILSNRPFIIFVLAYFFSLIAVGMWFSLLFIFVDTYLELGDEFALVSIVGLLAAIVSIFCWCKLSKYVCKKWVWICGQIMFGLGVFCLGWLDPAMASSTPLFIVVILSYGGFVAITIMQPSVLTDVIDYSSWKYGSDRAATYFSLQTLMYKLALAIGASLGLAVTAIFAFDPSISNHSETAILGLRLSVSWLPATMVFAAIVFVKLIPIDARRAAVIRRRLDSRSKKTDQTIDNGVSQKLFQRKRIVVSVDSSI